MSPSVTTCGRTPRRRGRGDREAQGHPCRHITLLRSERSPIAALVTEMLEEISQAPFPDAICVRTGASSALHRTQTANR